MIHWPYEAVVWAGMVHRHWTSGLATEFMCPYVKWKCGAPCSFLNLYTSIGLGFVHFISGFLVITLEIVS